MGVMRGIWPESRLEVTICLRSVSHPRFPFSIVQLNISKMS